MGLRKGQTNNPNGRPKGTIEGKEKGKKIREIVQDFILSEVSTLKERMRNLSDKDYCEMVARFMPYATARFQPVNESDGSDAQNVIQMPTILIQVPDQEKATALKNANPTMLLDSGEEKSPS